MRGHVHNAAVRFRISYDLLTAATNKARREGMSLSELLRHAVRNAVKDAA